MARYHAKHVEKPEDRKEERKLLAREHIEKGAKTSKGEKRALLGTKKKKK